MKLQVLKEKEFCDSTSAMEIKLFILLVNRFNSHMQLTFVNKAVKEEICELLNISEAHFRNVTTKLKKKGWIEGSVGAFRLNQDLVEIND